MNHFRQYDYPNVILGTAGRVSIKTSGCFITSLAMIAGMSPVEANEKLKKAGAFVSQNMLGDKRISGNALGLEYLGLAKTPEEANKYDFGDICVAETRDTSAPQHFFVYDRKKNMMSDPISKIRGWEECKYTIVSLRIFRSKISSREVKIENNNEQDLKEILQILKYFFRFSEEAGNEEGKVKASVAGRMIREIQADLGVEISL